MCLIIEQPEGHSLTDDDVRGIYARNRQGFGIMRFVDDDGGKAHATGLLARRWLVDDADHAVHLYREHAAGHRAVLHWRYATHGPVSLAMAHPFHVLPGLSVVHNGVIPNYGNRTESDTHEFVRAFVAPFLATAGRAFVGGAWDAVHDAGVQAELRKRIGRSVLCFMSGDGRIARVDAANLGTEYRGAWYSNTYAWDAPKRDVWRSSDVARLLVSPDDDRPAQPATLRLAGDRNRGAAGERVDAYLTRMKRTGVHPANPFARVKPRAPLTSVCPLCGQRIDDDKPCGCGARPSTTWHASTRA